MAKSLQFTKLDGREARSCLSRSYKPYWHAINPNCQLGYFKAEDLQIWIARIVQARNHVSDQRIGLADDLVDADGVRVLNFQQAVSAARNCYAEQKIKSASKPIDDSPFNKIGAACGRT